MTAKEDLGFLAIDDLITKWYMRGMDICSEASDQIMEQARLTVEEPDNPIQPIFTAYINKLVQEQLLVNNLITIRVSHLRIIKKVTADQVKELDLLMVHIVKENERLKNMLESTTH